MNVIETIRAEIKRRIEEDYSTGDDRDETAQGCLASLYYFLDTLEEKPVDLEKDAVMYCFDKGINLSPKDASEFARHFAEWGYLRAAEKYNEIEYNRQRASGGSEIPNNHEGLDAAAVDGADKLLAEPKDYALAAKADYWNGAHDGFKAGAEWDREQMLKEAVEGEIQVTLSGRLVPAITYSLDGSMFNLGDKVKLIIIKEEEK